MIPSIRPDQGLPRTSPHLTGSGRAAAAGRQTEPVMEWRFLTTSMELLELKLVHGRAME
jgi:hypothetical protein